MPFYTVLAEFTTQKLQYLFSCTSLSEYMHASCIYNNIFIPSPRAGNGKNNSSCTSKSANAESAYVHKQ